MAEIEPVFGPIKGMAQDYARENMPPGYAWSLLDLIPGIVGSNCRSRNGWIDMNLHAAAVNLLLSGVAITFESGAQDILTVVSDASAPPQDIYADGASIGTAHAVGPRQNPFVYRQSAIFPDGDGNNAAKIVKHTGAYSVASLPASALEGKYGCSYKDRVVLACSDAEPTRIAFAKPGDPTLAWDALSIIDTTLPITGIAALRNSILVFHESSMERIRGDTPPDSTLTDPTGNMVLEGFPVKTGCYDAFTIAYWQDSVLWADENGVYKTDGAATEDLAEKGHMSLAWQSIFDLGVNLIRAGTIGDFYIVTLWTSTTASMVGGAVGTEGGGDPHIEDFPGGGGEDKLTFLIHIPSRSWTRLTNIPAECYITDNRIGIGTREKLYAGVHFTDNSADLVDLTPCIAPTFADTTTGVDDNDIGFAPVIETPWFDLGGMGRERVKHAYVSYELGAVGGQPDPFLNIEYSIALSSEAGEMVYTLVSRQYPKTGIGQKRVRVPIRKGTQGLAMRLTVSGKFTFFNFYGIELEGWPLGKLSLARA